MNKHINNVMVIIIILCFVCSTNQAFAIDKQLQNFVLSNLPGEKLSKIPNWLARERNGDLIFYKGFYDGFDLTMRVSASNIVEYVCMTKNFNADDINAYNTYNDLRVSIFNQISKKINAPVKPDTSRRRTEHNKYAWNRTLEDIYYGGESLEIYTGKWSVQLGYSRGGRQITRDQHKDIIEDKTNDGTTNLNMEIRK